MANLIPNENSWIGFVPGDATNPFGVADYHAVTEDEVLAAIDVTDYLISLNASSTGNTVPTPRLRSLFETSIPGTSGAQFTADFYRDDENDLAWDTFPRATRGTFLVSRFGGTGDFKMPLAGDEIETWPIQVSSRAGGALQSGTAQTFTLTGSVPKEPDEDVVVAAAVVVPPTPPVTP
jgi:hypothetical protein